MIIGIVIDTDTRTADIYDNTSESGGKHINLYNADLYELVVKQLPRGIAEMYAERDGK